MSDPIKRDSTETQAPATESRYDLADRLERVASKLQGLRQDQFIDDKSVCNTCKHSQIVRRHNRNERVIWCHQLSKNVPLDLSECSSYQNLTELSLGQMADIAWLIDNRSDKKVGGYL